MCFFCLFFFIITLIFSGIITTTIFPTLVVLLLEIASEARKLGYVSHCVCLAVAAEVEDGLPP